MGSIQHGTINLDLSLLQKTLEENFSAPYMLFVFEDIISGKRVYFCTHDVWSANYINYGLIENCPIFNLGKKLLFHSKTRSVILPWWEVSPQNNQEKAVIGARYDHKIGDGLSIAKEWMGFRAFLGIAPLTNDKDFVNLYFKNKKMLRNAFLQSIDLAVRMMSQKEWLSNTTQIKLLEFMETIH